MAAPRRSLGVELHDSVIEDDPMQRRTGRVFERPNNRTLMQTSAKFQLASSDVPEDSQDLRVEGLALAGWCLVKAGQKTFKQRFLEIESGACRVYSTDPPEKIEFGGEAVLLTVDVADGGEARTVVKRGGATVLDLKSSVSTARLVAAAALGGGKDSRQICNATLLPRDQNAVLWLNGATLFLFDKRMKHSVELKSLEMATSDHADGHRLTCSKDGQEVLVIAVPEPLLLLRWIAALSACDTGEKRVSGVRRAESGGGEPASVVQQLVLQDSKRASMQLQRTYTLGVGRTLGVQDESENEVPTRQELKKEMLGAASFPSTVPPLREILADPQLRLFCYKWSRAQFSSENIKFYVACDNLLREQDESQKAAGLKKLADEYIASSAPSVVNISGAQRKRFLKAVSDAGASEAALAKLLPGVLSEPLAEIVRVMEFDIYTSLSALMNEVIRERSRPKAPAPSPHSADGGGLRSVRDALENDETLNALLLFAGTGSDQNEILFLAAVHLLKRGSPDTNAKQIFYTYCDSASPRYLDAALSFKRVNALERQMSDPGALASGDLFDGCVNDVVTHVDSGLFKRFLSSKAAKQSGKPAPPPKTTNRLALLGIGTGGGGGGGGGRRSPREEKKSPRK